MVEGKTKTGFIFKIDDEIRDDMELLEAITAYDEGQHNLMPKIVAALLGKDQKKALYEHCRGESGRVSAVKVVEEVADIFNEISKSEDNIKN